MSKLKLELEEQVKKILATFPEKRIRTDLNLQEDKQGNLYINTGSQLLQISLQQPEQGVKIQEVNKLQLPQYNLQGISRVGMNKGD